MKIIVLVLCIYSLQLCGMSLLVIQEIQTLENLANSISNNPKIITELAGLIKQGYITLRFVTGQNQPVVAAEKNEVISQIVNDFLVCARQAIEKINKLPVNNDHLSNSLQQLTIE